MASHFSCYLCLVILFLEMFFPIVETLLENNIAREVYSGRHFNDIMTYSEDTKSERAIVAGVLAMYSSKCENEMANILNIKRHTIPNDHFLVIMKHNYENYLQRVWYASDEEDNLHQRYMSKDDQCLKVMIWKAGAKINQPETLTAGLGLPNFIWWKFFIPLTISNKFDEEIALKIAIPGGNVAHEVNVKVNDEAEYHSFASLMITVFKKETGEFIYGELCTFRTQAETLVINAKVVEKFSEAYKASKNEQGQVDIHKWDKFITSLQLNLSQQDNIWRDALEEMYVTTLVFPVYISSLSLTGHETVPMESDILVPLQRLANSDTVIVGMTKESAQFTKEPVLNNREEATSMITISDQTRKTIRTSITPTVEKFAGCYVHLTSAVLRQLKPKTIIRDHVDTHDNHVITVLFVLGDVSKSSKEKITPIDIELVDTVGQRKSIKLYPGDMFLYESKATIFSMRNPVKQAKPYTIVQAYFEPSKNWSWRYFDESGKKVLTDGGDVKVAIGRSWPSIKKKRLHDHVVRSHQKSGIKEEARGTVETDPVTNEQHIEL